MTDFENWFQKTDQHVQPICIKQVSWYCHQLYKNKLLLEKLMQMISCNFKHQILKLGNAKTSCPIDRL